MNHLVTLTLVACAFFVAAVLAEIPWTRAQRRDVLVRWCNRLADRAEDLRQIAYEHDQQNGPDRDAWLKWDTTWPWYRFRALDMLQRAELRLYNAICRMWRYA